MENIEKLKSVIEVQCMNGNWNYDPYMHGMANGLLCALSIMTGKEPEYLQSPAVWLNEKSETRNGPPCEAMTSNMIAISSK
jgi:hypothetical protein